MGFRNPVLTAVDPVARQSAANALDQATNGIIPGSRLAADAINGKTITGNTITGATISGTTVTGGTVSGTTVTGATISGGTVTGTTVSGGTVTGSTVQTAKSGQRTQLDTPKGLQFFSGISGETDPARVYNNPSAAPTTSPEHALIVDGGGSAGQLSLGYQSAPAGGYQAVSSLTGDQLFLATNSNATVTTNGVLRIPNTGDVAPPTTVGGAVSTRHGLQIGADGGQRMLMDNNEMASVTVDANGAAILGTWGITASNVGISANLAGVADLRLNGTQGPLAANAVRKDYVDGKTWPAAIASATIPTGWSATGFGAWTDRSGITHLSGRLVNLSAFTPAGGELLATLPSAWWPSGNVKLFPIAVNTVNLQVNVQISTNGLVTIRAAVATSIPANSYWTFDHCQWL